MSTSKSFGRPHPSLFASGERCARCPARFACRAQFTVDACGHRSEYEVGGLVVEDAPYMVPKDLEFPLAVHWPDIPQLQSALVIGAAAAFEGRDGVRLREALRAGLNNASNSTHGVASLLGRDELLQRLARTEGFIGRGLAKAGFTLAISPGFSTWRHRSPFESAVASAHTASMAVSLSRHIPTIPTVVWRFHADLERWANWISSTEPSHISMDLGWARSARDWQWCIEGIGTLMKHLGRGAPHLVATGPSTLERMSNLRSAWVGGLTFASQSPWSAGQHGRLLLDDLTVTPDDRPFDQLLQANAETFRRAAEAAARTRGTVVGNSGGAEHRMRSINQLSA